MLKNTYEGQVCSIAGSLELIGERWTLLILRDSFLGVRRFDEFQSSLGVARNVLASRLEGLVENGVLERRPYQQRPERFEYRLTEKGLDLWPIVFEMLRWGDKHVRGGKPPVLVRHRECGGLIGERRICTKCGAEVGPRDVRSEPGPGARPKRDKPAAAPVS